MEVEEPRSEAVESWEEDDQGGEPCEVRVSTEETEDMDMVE